jgi:hypothetical protein
MKTYLLVSVIVVFNILYAYNNTSTISNYSIAEHNQIFDIDENIVGGEVGQIAMTVSDDADLNFTIMSEHELFTINTNTRIIYLKQDVSLNYEAINQYTFNVNISDDSSESTITVTVNVNDTNDKPVIKKDTLYVNENVANTVDIGKLTAFDEDNYTQFTDWKIVRGNDHNTFRIHPTSGKIKVNDNTWLDREINEEFTIAVSVSDGTNTSDLVDIRIIVTDVNDNAPIVPSNQTFTISENSEKGSVIGTVTATDADKNTTFSNWIIKDGIGDQLFSINHNTGKILLATTPIDYEEKAVYKLRVTVSDGENTSIPKEITINIKDVNDNKPIIEPNQTFNIESDISAGSIVGTIEAHDADTETTLQQWNMESGNISETFSINPETGILSVKDPKILRSVNIDFFSLNITVTDGLYKSDIGTVKIMLNKTTNMNRANELANEYYNYKTKQLHFYNTNCLKPHTIVISNINGNIIDTLTITPETNSIDISHLKNSIYILTLIYQNTIKRNIKIVT